MRIRVILPWLWAGFILVLVGLPGYRFPSMPVAVPGFDKLVHASLFGIWAVLLRRAGISFFLSALLVVVYSGLTELGQAYFFIQRTADPFDHIANSLGGGIGLWLSTITTKGKPVDRDARNDIQKNNS